MLMIKSFASFYLRYKGITLDFYQCMSGLMYPGLIMSFERFIGEVREPFIGDITELGITVMVKHVFRFSTLTC